MDAHFIAIVRARNFTTATRRVAGLWWWSVESPTVGTYTSPDSYIIKRHAQTAMALAIQAAEESISHG